ILQELIQWARFGDAPPWERDANWWKQGVSTSPWHSSDSDDRSSLVRQLFPWLAGGTFLILGIWWAYDADRAAARREAHARLTQLGAVFGWDGHDTFYGVRLRGPDVRDAEAALLTTFANSSFEGLDLARTGITNEGLRSVGKLQSLRILYLH